MNKPNFAALFESARYTLSKHSPEILTGVGIAGIFTTAVLAVKYTPKALQLIEEKKEELGVEKLAPIDTVKATWKCYIPAAVSATVSTVCLVGSTQVSLRRNAALATALKLSETALVDYREKVVETIGETKEQTVREKVAQKQIDKTPITKNEIIIAGDGDTIFLDPLSKRYFKSDIDSVHKVENKLNKQMLHDICGEVSVNEFYDELGIDRTDIGDYLGWTTEHLIDLDISPGITENGKPCLVIGHYNPPTHLN